ncbi:potassium channel family protein [Corynebacterium pygosceleis]|uniref:Potassium channel family protein n=1 Tax=Corynebacterium pygosceleis TaxID=2800406 RepID=A0A9Q4GLC9_9CORY|nr:potassium channel family protein [Corynebacterium pygosceleis]MCK7638408.1 potassium channel family protein [Corynebacterium pygosceleis]MCK7675388.1 potassium channel family protein [Corynebacterium pygosceleis]MCL0121218.1 potassium channel family protein [Corynebacterium pygosceleis]MCX7469072.1 potassium channel family protein [Corynebacterium pygosceleis]
MPDQSEESPPDRELSFPARVKSAYLSLFHPEIPDDAPAQQRWEARVEGPMIIVSVIFLVLFIWASIGRADARWTRIAEYGMWLTWWAFIVDYVIRLYLAERRARWFWRHFHEFLLVVLPWFRPLRLLRILPVIFLVQRFSATNKRVTVAAYTGVASVLLILISALSIYDVEHGRPDSQITTFFDAVWWSIVTVTTVGYGDITPSTIGGRFIGIAVMLGGIAVAGVVTATFASWLVQQVEDEDTAAIQDQQQAVRRELRGLHREVRELRGQLARMTEQQEQLIRHLAGTGEQPPTAPPEPPVREHNSRGGRGRRHRNRGSD